ncbi:MAG: phosphopyruvate hydratase, partial [Thermodesulfobacteriota bacterium]
VAHASANSLKIPLYEYIHKTYNLPYKDYKLPKPMMVVLEGGKHADNSTDFQEYMVSPVGMESVRESVRAGVETYLYMKKVLKEKGYNTNVGNEGAYAPAGLKDNEEPLDIIVESIKKAGYEPGTEVAISLDPATSEIYKDGYYHLEKENRKLTSLQLIDYLSGWVDKYPILTLEDALAEDDWDFWPILTGRLGKKIRIVGDDLLVTNIERIKKAVQLKAVNAVLIKLNQIGTLTETVQSIEYTHQNDFMSIVSHRGGGETNDVTMIDLAVATNSEFVKVGPSRGERVVKYNRLMEIEDEVIGL